VRNEIITCSDGIEMGQSTPIFSWKWSIIQISTLLSEFIEGNLARCHFLNMPGEEVILTNRIDDKMSQLCIYNGKRHVHTDFADFSRGWVNGLTLTDIVNESNILS
jgi:hypothetical protein